MARPNCRAEREQPEIATIHVANTMMTNDTLPYIVTSVDPGIEIAFAQRKIQNPSEDGIQICHKGNLSHHQMSVMLENRHSQR